MSQSISISTTSYKSQRRMQAWNHAVSQHLAPAVAEPGDASTFRGELRATVIGDVCVAAIQASAAHVQRLPLPRRSARCVVTLVLAGELEYQADDVQTRLGAGDLWLYGPCSGASLELKGQTSLLALSAPSTRLGPNVCGAESDPSRVIRGGSAAAPFESAYLRALWDCLENQLPVVIAPRLANVAIQMLVGAFASNSVHSPPTVPPRQQHFVRIHTYIERHLRDPRLTPTTISAALGITVGYLHRIFSGGGESIERYILRRRLEGAYEALGDCMQYGRQITEIAFDWGFENMPHFCRAFRTQYGISPGVRQRGAPLLPMSGAIAAGF